jgi:predicted nucleic acid-binding protein
LTRCVLDASVAAKWFLPRAHEQLSDEATQLLEAYTKGRLTFLVPDLFWCEFGSIMWKAARTKRIAQVTAGEAVDAMLEMSVSTVSNRELLSSAFSIAKNFDRSVYDATYVALAVLSNVDFVTADERLVNGLGLQFPVRWLGSL